MKRLDKNSTWWIGSERDWSYQDEDGSWWLLRNEEKKEKKENMNPCLNPISNLDSKKLNILAKIFSWHFVAVIVFMGILGVSLTLNILQYFYIKSVT